MKSKFKKKYKTDYKLRSIFMSIDSHLNLIILNTVKNIFVRLGFRFYEHNTMKSASLIVYFLNN